MYCGCGGGDGAAPDLGASDLGVDAAGDASADLGAAPDGACTTDADGDGHRATACGGDDCDDADATRYPGNAEVCDAVGHDEDCDPATLGPDTDGDTFVYLGCCDQQPSGTLLCGTDCDDHSAAINPSAPEVCDGRDDDCDGMVDEGVTVSYCLDRDGDLFGDLATAHTGCALPLGATGTCNDCADGDPSRHPGATELCDGIDQNCDGVVDEGCPTCAPGATRPCGAAVGACMPGIQTCSASGWGASCVGATLPSVETCNGVDDDCDGMTDEGLGATFYADCDGDGFGADASAMHRCAAPSTPPACAHGLWAMAGGDCDDADPTRYPGHCTGIDGGTPDAGTDAGCDPASCVYGRCTSGGVCDDLVAFALDYEHLCVARAGGSVLCAGGNSAGELGDGTTTTSSVAVSVLLVSDAVGVSAGGSFSCALRRGGGAKCWGAGISGQLGDGLSSGSHTAVSVSALTDGTAIASCGGGTHTCALRAGGLVSCWGSNSYGQCGASGGGNLAVATPVAGLSAVVSVGVGGNHSCAVFPGGGVECWGRNASGQLGDGTMSDHATPTGVVFGAAADAVQVVGGQDHTCVRRATGALYCWGYGASGQLGFGGSTSQSTPVDVLGVSDAVDLCAGEAHTCAVHRDGTVSCWGANGAGQLGDGTTTGRLRPTAVSGLADAAHVYCGRDFTCVVRRNGGGECWGSNPFGCELTGTAGHLLTPTPIIMPP